MHTNRQIHSAAFVFALVLSGCPIGGGTDEIGADETANETTSGDSTTTSTTSSTSATDDASTDDASTDDTSTDDTSTSSTDDTSTQDTGTSSTDESTDTDTSTDTETDTVGDTGNPDCELNDVWEPNPSALEPSIVAWQSVSDYSAYRLFDDLYLCPGEGDWYHFDVESLAYAEHYFYLRALVDGAGLCGADCGDPVIPPGPEHAMTIEVFRADNMQLLLTSMQDDGVFALGGSGDNFAHELLIHVFSPTPAAEYPYQLTVEIRNYDGEDECEC
jgi:hypothetical protein